jgi:asparagine synthetase A
LKEIKNLTLKNIFLTNIFQNKKERNFDFFKDMVNKIVKTNREENKLSFLFDIFSNFKDEINYS